MKIIKQLSKDEFVIKLEEHDKKIKSFDSMRIAHDYIQFNTDCTLYTDGVLISENGEGSSNTLGYEGSVQINIRTFVDKYLPIILNHPFCKKEHLYYNGTPKYTYGVEFVYTNDCVSIRKDGSDKWEDMTWSQFTLTKYYDYYNTSRDNKEMLDDYYDSDLFRHPEDKECDKLKNANNEANEKYKQALERLEQSRKRMNEALNSSMTMVAYDLEMNYACNGISKGTKVTIKDESGDVIAKGEFHSVKYIDDDTSSGLFVELKPNNTGVVDIIDINDIGSIEPIENNQ